jgi:hypothetical protein
MEEKVEILDWLLKAAEKIVGKSDPPIPLLDILRQFDAQLVVSNKKTTSNSLAFLQRDGQRYKITLERTDISAPLSSRELFSLAHELGHLLLIRQYNWQPNTKQAHYETEALCHRFAGELLIPRKLVQRFNPVSARNAIQYLQVVMHQTGASAEPVARRFIECYQGLAFFSARRIKNKAGEAVWCLWWGVSSHPGYSLKRAQHLSVESALGAYLESVSTSWTLTDTKNDHMLDKTTSAFSRTKLNSILVALHTS